jgi:Zn-dependent peptidase ImmA (M78 family)
MHFLVERFRSLGIGWNERRLGESDALGLCRRFGITFLEMPLTTRGFYFRLQGKDHIAVDSGLSETQRTFVIFHELGHYLLHAPASGAAANFHRVGERTRTEREADLFALCALVPRDMVENSIFQEMPSGHDLEPEQIADRLEIYEVYGI